MWKPLLNQNSNGVFTVWVSVNGKRVYPISVPRLFMAFAFFFISTFSIVFTDVKGLAFFAFRSENHDRSDFRIRWRLRRERDSWEGRGRIFWGFYWVTKSSFYFFTAAHFSCSSPPICCPDTVARIYSPTPKMWNRTGRKFEALLLLSLFLSLSTARTIKPFNLAEGNHSPRLSVAQRPIEKGLLHFLLNVFFVHW